MLASRSVTTTGHGSVALPRTSAVLRVAATHRADGLAAALEGAESARAAIVDVARQHLEASAIATQSLDVWPGHDDVGQRAGFDARHTLALRCPDLAVAGALVQALAEEVGDRLVVDGVNLAAVPTDDDLRTARERAFADARARAEHLAGLSGASLGTVLSVSEGGGGAARDSDVRFLEAKADAGFEGGQEDVSVVVTVTWDLV